MSDNDDFKEVPRQLWGIDLAHKQALILCTQYDVDDWYYRIDCDRAEDEGSAVAEGILDRIINNKHSIEVKGRISMRKRHAFSDEGNGVNDNGW